jgi:histidyl-tRNA synthetase
VLLQEFLMGCELDQETSDRARINPLRVLDDKRDAVQSQLDQAPLMVDHLCNSCRDHYNSVRKFLTASNVVWRENPRLVRGLDYYTRTTFEFVHPGLGAQSGIGGGGRYDGLMAELGGTPMSGIGFGLGTDRTLLACEAEGLTPFRETILDIYFIAIDPESQLQVVQLMADLRTRGIACEMSVDSRSMKSAMKNADRTGATFVGILGEQEREQSTVELKNMATGEQVSLHSTAIGIYTHIKDINKGNETNRKASP